MFKILMVLLLLVRFVEAQTFAEYFDQANEAFRNKDYAANVELLQKTIEAGGDHPTILYFLARGQALSGKPVDAVKTLNQLADLGLSYQPEEDPNFKGLKDSPEFALVQSRFQANRTPTNNSEPVITIDDPQFIPEGIAYDPTDRTFYFGGIASRSILSFTDGKFTPLSKPGDGLWSVLGMKVDPRTHSLWAASASLSGEDKGKSGIFHYDLKQKKLLHRYVLPDGDHGIGEVVLDSKGTVYATDSSSPAVYVLKDGKVEQLIGPEPFRSPQGACLSPDEKTLFVADYSRGIFAIDLETRKFRKLARDPQITPVAGIDGLYFYKDSLIAIQNGVQPNRVLQIFVNQDATKIERIEVLESNHKIFPEPTLGAVVGDDLYYIGNSMIGPYLEDPKTELKPAVILKLPLKH